jgi:hypothetical protein
LLSQDNSNFKRYKENNETSVYKSILNCGKTKIQSITRCYNADNCFYLCSEQYFIFNYGKPDKEVKISSGGELNGVACGKIGLDFVAGSWACVPGNTGEFVIVSSGNGGNCNACERLHIYDLAGNMLADDNNFSPTYKMLELPKPWPRHLFKKIAKRRANE